MDPDVEDPRTLSNDQIKSDVLTFLRTEIAEELERAFESRLEDLKIKRRKVSLLPQLQNEDDFLELADEVASDIFELNPYLNARRSGGRYLPTLYFHEKGKAGITLWHALGWSGLSEVLIALLPFTPYSKAKELSIRFVKDFASSITEAYERRQEFG